MIRYDNKNFPTNDFPLTYKVVGSKIVIKDEDIISTIKTYCPTAIDKEIHYFPLNKKYLITDKKVVFSILYDLRGLHDKELRSYNYHKRKSNEDKQNNLIEKANNRVPYLHRMSDTRNSIRISIHDKIKDTAEHYGYSVKIADTPTYHYYYKRDSNGMLKKVKDTENPTFSQYIELCISTFVSLCQHGKMVRKGYTLNDNGDEVKIRRGRGDTAFSFIDTTTRTEYNYSSKREAAQQFFDCDESTLRRVIKKGTGHSFIFRGIPYMITN